MARFGTVLAELIDNNSVKADALAHELDVSRTYIYSLKKKDSVDMELLEKVCRIFKINPVVFFDSDVARYDVPVSTVFNNTAVIGQATMNLGVSEELNILKKLVDDKERFIQHLLKQLESVGVNL